MKFFVYTQYNNGERRIALIKLIPIASYKSFEKSVLVSAINNLYASKHINPGIKNIVSRSILSIVISPIIVFFTAFPPSRSLSA